MVSWGLAPRLVGNTEASCMTYISYGSMSVNLGDIPGAMAFAVMRALLAKYGAGRASRLPPEPRP